MDEIFIAIMEQIAQEMPDSLSSTRTTDNWKWEQKKTSTRSLSLVY